MPLTRATLPASRCTWIPQWPARGRLLDSHGFVRASVQEPVAASCPDAMACAAPVIATDVEGVPDNVSGRLVPPRSPGLMARALRDLGNDPDAAMRLSQGGRERVAGRFTAAAAAALEPAAPQT